MATPFFEDVGPLRILRFDPQDVQSVMRRDDPAALCLAYTRKMMCFLLFNPAPRRVLLLGLGGGSLAKFCYHHLPGAAITVVEIDPQVMALRTEFQVPADDRRFRVVQADAARYIARRGPRADVILLDACDRDGLAPALSTPGLYENLRRSLAPGGVLVVNLCGWQLDIENHLGRVRAVFGDRLVNLPAREDGNLIVLALRCALPDWDGVRLDAWARRLERQFGLAFPRFVRQMTRGGSQAI